MRDDPYPARFYGRQMDEPFLTDLIATSPPNHSETLPYPTNRPLTRLLLLLMALYLCCALFFIFAVSSYAAPLGSATTHSQMAGSCIEAATLAAQ